MPQYGIDPLTGKPVRLSQANPGMGSGLDGVRRFRDLMSRLPAADLRGAIGPGVVPGGEQGHGARRAEIEQAGQPHAPETYRPLGGAQQNYRGNGREIVIGGADYQAQNVMVVQTPKDAGDDAEEIGIQCGVEQVEVDLNSFLATPIDLVGRVLWGVGGASFSAEFDWMLGTRFSVVASFCQVALVLPSTDSVGTPLNTYPAVNLRVDAALAYGRGASSPQASPARRTIPNSVGAGATVNVRIPNYATSFTIVEAAPLGPGSYTLVLSDDVGNTVAVYSYVGSSNAFLLNEGTFPIPNGARRLAITNLGVGAGRPNAIFNLTF